MLKDLKLNSSLPELGKFTIGKDFADIMIQEILQRKPKCILEAGSGISTVLAAYCLQKLGGGTIVSLEHLTEYACLTRNWLKQHLLSAINVQVLNTPLCEYELKQNIYHWYQLDLTKIPTQIDFLIVDGPPRATGSLARYPILPLLYERLSPSAVIFLDDADRNDEKLILQRWLIEYPQFKSRYYNTQKGAVLLSHD